MKRKSFILGALLAAVVTVSGAWTSALAQGTPYKVGVTPGPHAQIMDVVKRVAARDGLNIEVIEFSNYVLPNEALVSGELNANSFQHKPYLDNQIQNRGYQIVSVAETVLFPMGLYSKSVGSVAEIKAGSRIGIPNDPTNGGRALLLLQQLGLIKLAPNVGMTATPLDIKENPLNLKIIELDAAQMPRALAELDAGAVNTNYALPAGLDPKKDAIALESTDSPYMNIIAVRAADKDSPELAKLLRAYFSPEVKQFIEDEFKGSILAAW
ncbi:D-methionine-binding lipoprotein MetQ [Saezia sanguinis]|uniref:Lipoprotein n=1 Tax=Saezia sanguinis TaxID=1965230 RepID=A0A433SB73_9BURK|nr:MetQ/NlpA family ABC transporter substrate-binding protein [Saezia sanguinis]RUS65894.1 D-methionine-binding lipoprotein MetQ [Saezia sanguinis]